MREKTQHALVGRILSLFLFAVMMVSLAPASAFAAPEDRDALAPGTYSISANVSMPGQYNPLIPGLTVYPTTPNNPFGPTIDENVGLSVENGIPSSPVTSNATLHVAEDGTKTLLVPFPNPIFTLQALGTSAEISDSSVERVAPTNWGGGGMWEGNYNKRTSRVHKARLVLTDTQTSGTKSYTFKGSELYAVPLDRTLTPSGDVSLQLDVDYDSATRTGDGTDAPVLETSRVVVNVPKAVKGLAHTGEELKGVFVGDNGPQGFTLENGRASSEGLHHAVATLKEGHVWADGTTDPKTIDYTIGDEVDLSGLEASIKAAKAESDGATVSTDGKDVSSDGQWVTQGDKDTLDGAIAKAREARDANGATNASVTAAEEELDKAVSTFKASKRAGTKPALVATVPTAVTGLVYNGQEQTGVSVAGEGYRLYNNSGKDAGNYSAMAILDSDHVWPDGTTDIKLISWSIARATVEVPSQGEVPTFTGGLVYSPYDNGDGYVRVSGLSGATLAGTYTNEVKPDKNHQWPDGGIGTKTVTWKIDPVKVDPPEVRTGLTYNGYQQYGIDLKKYGIKIDRNDYYKIDGTYGTFVPGTYRITVRLLDKYRNPDGSVARCFVWSDGTYGAKELTWTIAKAPLVATAESESVSFGTMPKLSAKVTGWPNPVDLGALASGGYVAPGVQVVDADGSVIGASELSALAPGTYTIRPFGGELGDASIYYEFSKYVDATLTVTPRGQLAVPDAVDGLVYDGTEQTGVPQGEHYTLSGDTKATDAGSYTATAVPEAGYTWSDGTTEAKSIYWSIARKQLPRPEAKVGLVYDGTEQTGVPQGEGYTLSGDVKATDAGSYTATATLTSDNYEWAPAATRGTLRASVATSDSVSITWSIAKAKLTATYQGDTIRVGETPALKVDVTGFVGGETAESVAGYVAPTVPVTEAQLAAPGSYELPPQGGNAGGNYEFDYQPGTLVVQEAAKPDVPGSGGNANNGGAGTGSTSRPTKPKALPRTGDKNGLLPGMALVLLGMTALVGSGAAKLRSRQR